MPELPEVETMRRGILPVLGCRIVDVCDLPTAWKPITITPAAAEMRQLVRRRRIVAVERLGKRVLLRLDDDGRIVFEPRMTGLVLLADPPDVPHLRWEMRLAEGSVSRLWYWDRRGLGSVRWLSAEEWPAYVAAKKLGPDALDISSDEFRDRLRQTRRPIKVALLDQQRVAGIGNLYASEILHLCQVHPQLPAHRLSREQWERIHTAMREVLLEAIRYEGSTLSDGTYRTALNQAGGYQNQHRVYDLAGELCRSCRHGVVQRIVQAQRSTFFCPQCQTRSRKSLHRATPGSTPK